MVALARLHPLIARFDARAVRRALVAGSAWGVTLGLALTAMNAWNCGFVCPEDAAITTAISVAAGILTIGPLAAIGAPQRA